MPGIRLRPVEVGSPEEVQRVVQFVNRYLRGPFPLKSEALSSGRVKLFWAIERGSGKRVGVTGYLAKTPDLAETVKTVVHPRFRGQGLGSALSRAIEREVKRAGFKKVMTTIYVDNLPMIFIKLKQGYRFEGFHPDHEKPGLHEYSFGKVLHHRRVQPS